MFQDNRIGNTPRFYWDKPKDWNMRIPEIFRKCVVFLGRASTDKDGQEQIWFGGTAFIVSVPAPLSSDRGYLYIVTAKHVVDGLAGCDAVARLNGKDGLSKDFRMPMDHKWWFHPCDDATDVAVTEFHAIDQLDYAFSTVDAFLDQRQLCDGGIGAGDDVFMVGLFTRMRGREKILPLVRMGNVAMIPDPGELVPGVKIGPNKFVDAEAYLIEARSIGGLSGSPVFVHETVGMEVITSEQGRPGTRQVSTRLPGRLFLFGLMNGHWEIDPNERNYPFPRAVPRDEAVNMGIAVVIPAKKIKETLYHPELVGKREASDREYIAAHGTTMD